MNWLEALSIASVLTTLVYASYRDVKYRDIPEVTWVPATLISVAANIKLGNYDPLHTLFSVLPATLMLIMAWLGLVGGADFLALLMIAIAHPKFTVLPISLLTLTYSLLIPLALLLYYVILNTLKYGGILKTIVCIDGRKLYLKVFGRPMRVSKFIQAKFIYPLTIPSGSGFICRATFSDDDEEERIRADIVKALEEGRLSEDQLIWVTPGLPHVLFFLIGYVLALLTPQSLLLSLLTQH